MLDDVLQSDKQFGVCLVDRTRSVLGWEAPHQVGTVAKVTKVEDMDVMGQNTYIETIGRQRFRILKIIEPAYPRPAHYNPFDNVVGVEKEKEMGQAKTNAWRISYQQQSNNSNGRSEERNMTSNSMGLEEQKPYLRAEVQFMPEIDENVSVEDWQYLVDLWKKKIRGLSKPREISDHELDHVLQNYDLLTEAPTMDFVYSLAALGAKEPEDIQPVLEANTLQEIIHKVEKLFKSDK